MDAEFDVKPISEIPAEEAVNLLEKGMGKLYGREKNIRLWVWKHLANPVGPSLGVAAFERSSGELVGLRPFMRWQLITPPSSEFLAVRAVDTVVHPDFRRRGLFARMTKIALHELHERQVELVFNTPNDKSGPGYQKLGWCLLGHPQLAIRLQKPFQQVIRKLSTSRASQRQQIIMPEHWKPYREAHERFVEMTSYLSCERRVQVAKSSEFLWWRYAENPVFEYRVVDLAEADGSFLGLAIVREDQREGLQGVAVVEMLLRQTDFRTIRSAVTSLFSGSAADYFILAAPRSRMKRRRLTLNGFLPIRWRNVVFAVRPVLISPSEELCRNHAEWNLSLGDLELF